MRIDAARSAPPTPAPAPWRDWWVTVMGDVPPATVKAFADSLQKRGADPFPSNLVPPQLTPMIPEPSSRTDSPWSRLAALGLARRCSPAPRLGAGRCGLPQPAQAPTVQLPDFTELAERVGPVGGEHPHHREGAALRARRQWQTPTSRSSSAASASRCLNRPEPAPQRASRTRATTTTAMPQRSSAAWAPASSSAPTAT